ncbi:hypothetical protein HDU98_007283 [Podochytrium sp. JEL0797]|nr:hypothetical protein HDU98_007283 [Podochytrium sp. JEL0797]
MAALQAGREGRSSDCQELFKEAYLTLAAEQPFLPLVEPAYFHSLQYIMTEIRPSDEAFFKNILTVAKAPTHHRAMAAFAFGQLRGTAKEQIFYGNGRVKASIREFLTMPRSMLTAAKLSLDAMNITHYYTSEETDKIVAVLDDGQECTPIEIRKHTEFPRFQNMIFHRSPGHQCDECDVLPPFGKVGTSPCVDLPLHSSSLTWSAFTDSKTRNILLHVV